jgi:hypothetical protein
MVISLLDRMLPMCRLLKTAVATGVFVAVSGSCAFGVISPVPTGSAVAGGFYSNLGSPILQDPAGYGFTSLVPVGPYLPGTALLAPSGPSTTLFGLGPGVNFQSTPVNQAFNDGLPIPQRANSVSVITHTYPLLPTNRLEDIHVDLPLFGVKQATGATGYVASQLNFISSYVISGTALGGGGFPVPAIVAKGKFGPAGYAQFQAVFNYTFTPFGSTSNLGVPVPLGNITYDFNATPPGLPFSFSVPGVNNLINHTSTANGLLDIHGYAWIAGDPFELEISTTVPEPVSLVLFVVPALLMGRPRRS